MTMANGHQHSTDTPVFWISRNEYTYLRDKLEPQQRFGCDEVARAGFASLLFDGVCYGCMDVPYTQAQQVGAAKE